MEIREYFEAPELELNKWLELKRGKFSASLIHKIMKGFNNETSQTYIDTLAGESIGVYDDDPFQSQAMINGSVQELTAMQVYIANHAKGEVLYGSKIFIPLGENAGVSPDGIEYLENESIYLEVKCPSAPNKYVGLLKCKDTETLKKKRPDVYWQCVMNMLVLGCQSAKVLLYHHNRGLNVLNVERIEADINELQTALTKAIVLKLELTQSLLA